MSLLKKKMQRFLMVACILVLALAFAGCGNKKPTYEGGNMAITYDEEKWELSYADTEPYHILYLEADEEEIVIMMIENDGSAVEDFHEDIIGSLEIFGEVDEEGKTDKWKEEAWLYYEDYVETDSEEGIVITYAKGQDDMLLVAVAEIMGEEDETEAAKEEVLKILGSLAYSEEDDLGDLEECDEEYGIDIFYDMLIAYTESEEEPDNDVERVEKSESISDEELEELEYVEKMTIEDGYGGEAEYDVYVPKGSEYDYDMVFYWEHGLLFTASGYDAGADAFMYDTLEESVEFGVEEWEDNSACEDIEVGDIVKSGDDRYQIITAKKEDYNGTLFEIKRIFFLDMQGKGEGVLWDLEMSESSTDDTTNLIIDELAQCYGIDLDEIKASGEYFENEAKRVEQE